MVNSLLIKINEMTAIPGLHCKIWGFVIEIKKPKFQVNITAFCNPPSWESTFNCICGGGDLIGTGRHQEKTINMRIKYCKYTNIQVRTIMTNHLELNVIFCWSELEI
jgi:hypothetical protein